ncbi:MAG: ATP-binding protein [Verrucomicrobiota bacterium]
MLTTVLIAAIVLLVWFYERRWRRIRRIIRELGDSIDADRELLMDGEKTLSRKSGLSQLMTTIGVKMEERMRLQEQSTSQMEQIDTTFRNMREGAVVIDGENRILVSNRSADRLLNEGLPMVGRRVERFVHHPSFLDLVREVGEENKYGYRQIEVDLMGRTAWLEISGASLDSGSGEGLSLYLINDITRLKKLEAIRRDFAANVSHELRTPITIIKGFAETLYEDGASLSETQKTSFVEKIHRNTERLHRLVEDLLSLSRLESRTLELNKERVDLVSEVRTFTEEFRKPKSATADLKLDCPSDPVWVELDRTYLNRVLSNLVENAFKHGISCSFVEIGIEEDVDRGVVEVTVTDDGVGVPERARDRIFQRFYRLDKGRSTRTGGTGLGLSIVRHALLAHGGNVRVMPVLPHGTRFICVFPKTTRSPEEIVE